MPYTVCALLPFGTVSSSFLLLLLLVLFFFLSFSLFWFFVDSLASHFFRVFFVCIANYTIALWDSLHNIELCRFWCFFYCSLLLFVSLLRSYTRTMRYGIISKRWVQKWLKFQFFSYFHFFLLMSDALISNEPFTRFCTAPFFPWNIDNMLLLLFLCTMAIAKGIRCFDGISAMLTVLPRCLCYATQICSTHR